MAILTRLALTDFRNHAAALIEPAGGFVLLSGPNGAGKTNLLEAVSLLTPGRGLRQVAISEMARSEGPGGFSIAAILDPRPFRNVGARSRPARSDDCRGQSAPRRWEEPQSGEGAGQFVLANAAPSDEGLPRPPAPAPEGAGEVPLGTGTIPAAPDRRQVRINGVAASVNSLSEWLSVLWLTPAMDRLFVDSAGARRRFLDRLTLALEPGHATHAARYEAAMRARNKLLAEPDSADPSWLAALEIGMAEHGAALGEARARTVAALTEAAAEQVDDDFPRSALALDGWDCGDLAPALKASRGRDAIAGRTLVGPHRQDLSVVHVVKHQPAARGSTGEQKALLLGLILAHADLVATRRGQPPILLLDEVAAHLDPARREALFDRLSGRGQVWMTATEEALFASISTAAATCFHVESGAVTAA